MALTKTEVGTHVAKKIYCVLGTREWEGIWVGFTLSLCTGHFQEQIEYSISTLYFTSSTKHGENVDYKEEITLKGSPQR